MFATTARVRVCQAAEVLDRGGEVELVSGAGQSAQAKSLEAELTFDVREQHLDLLALGSCT